MYLLALLPPVIGTLPYELDLLFDDGFDEHVARFATESGGVVYIVKVKDKVEGLSSYSYLHIDCPWFAFESTMDMIPVYNVWGLYVRFRRVC